MNEWIDAGWEEGGGGGEGLIINLFISLKNDLVGHGCLNDS